MSAANQKRPQKSENCVLRWIRSLSWKTATVIQLVGITLLPLLLGNALVRAYQSELLRDECFLGMIILTALILGVLGIVGFGLRKLENRPHVERMKTITASFFAGLLLPLVPFSISWLTENLPFVEPWPMVALVVVAGALVIVFAVWSGAQPAGGPPDKTDTDQGAPSS